jgi:flavin reductase (DIM6/NTAB) family NADH-FMN oxidoreductase RutF
MSVLPDIRNLVFPLPVALVTCRARRDGAAADNIIPLSWVGILDHQPHTVSISIGKQKYSARVIGESKEFGLCVASVELMASVDRCGYAHGDRTDKFAMTGLTKAAAVKIDAPLIAECPVCLECRVTQAVELGTHRMFVAEVLCTHVAEEFIDTDGSPDLQRMNVLCYADDKYWALGKKLQTLYYTRSTSG